jgi:hypothetical protein
MPDTDPFGREKGEDPLAAMGWSASDTVAPDAGPADVAAPEPARRAARRQARRTPRLPAPPRVPRVRRRSNAGCAFSVVVLGFIVIVATPIVSDVLDAIDSIEEGIDSPPNAPTPGPGPRDGAEQRERERGRPARPPQGLARGSLLRRENLAAALRRLQRRTGSQRVRLLRVDAQAIFAITVLADGRSRVARATWEGDAEVTTTTPGGGGATSFRWSQVDAAAPARIVRATTRGRSSRADYLVLLDAAGLRWSLFLKGGARYSASLDGRSVTRAG